MKILSLCDGLSCGQMAFEKAGISVEKYYASEIKNTAINITKKNFPNTIQIGNVNNVSYHNGILHTEVGDFKENFDIVIFGSPCQSFSRAMILKNKIGLNDPIRSGLFFQCYRILKEVNPQYFLMENVIMNKLEQNIISDYIGVEPVKINSKIVAAQMMERLYWTNIKIKNNLQNKNIEVNDILIDGYYPYKKARCLMKNDSHGYYNGSNYLAAKRFYRWYYEAFSTLIFPNENIFSNYLNEFNSFTNGKTINAELFNNYNVNHFNQIRYLWKEERARLQTIPEKYIKDLSEKDAADLIGDGWTVDIIAHILSFIK